MTFISAKPALLHLNTPLKRKITYIMFVVSVISSPSLDVLYWVLSQVSNCTPAGCGLRLHFPLPRKLREGKVNQGIALAQLARRLSARLTNWLNMFGRIKKRARLLVIMGIGKTLDDLIAKIKIPPKLMGVASVPLTSVLIYSIADYSLNQPAGDIRLPALAVCISLLGAVGITIHLDQIKAFTELGIQEDDFKKYDGTVTPAPEKDKNLVQRIWDSWLLHPKISGFAIGTTPTAFYFYKALSSGYLDLMAMAQRRYDTALSLGSYGLLCYFSYFTVKALSRMVSTSAAPLFFGLFPAILSLNTRAKIRALERLSKKTPNKGYHFDLARYYIEESELDTALEIAKEAVSLPRLSLPTLKFSDTIKFKITFGYARFRQNRGNIAVGVALAWHCNELGRPEIADKILSQMTEEADSAEASAVAAWWLTEAFGRKDEAEAHWNSTFQHLFDDPSVVVKPVGEGINHVYQLGGKFMRDLLMFKEMPPEKIRDERRVMAFMTALPKEPIYSQPRDIATFIYRNGSQRHVLVLQRSQGKTFLEKARQGSVPYDDLLTAIDYSFLLYRSIPPDFTSAKKADLKWNLASIVENPYFGLPQDLQQSIKRHAELIAEDLTGYDVFALDPHIGNWLTDGKVLTKLDCEGGRDSLYKSRAKLLTHDDLTLRETNLNTLRQEAS